jgi:hypothetical protein
LKSSGMLIYSTAMSVPLVFSYYKKRVSLVG